MAVDALLLFTKWQGIALTIKELKMSRNSSKRNSSNRGSTGSDIARSTLKVFLSNGDSRSVKCGEATDVKVGSFFLLFTSSCRGNIFLQFMKRFYHLIARKLSRNFWWGLEIQLEPGERLANHTL